MKIILLSDEAIRLEVGGTGTLEIVAESAEVSYSPFHMLASSLATCIASVLLSWGEHAKLTADDLAIEVRWTFAEEPLRVNAMDVRLAWPSLPTERASAATRASELCTIHATLHHPPAITIAMDAA
jgi:putative redox protein